MTTKNYLLFFFFLFFLFLDSHQYSITYIDEIKSNYIIPIINENDGCLYIVTGETIDDDNNFKPGDAIYKRIITKFNANSGVLKNTYSYMSVYPFMNSEITFAGDNSKYILTTTLYSLELDDGKKRKEMPYEVSGYKRTIRRIWPYYYYMHSTRDSPNIMVIQKMKLSFNSGTHEDLPSYNIIQTSEHIPIFNRLSDISCDFTKDNNYISCAYFGDNKYVKISVYNSNDLECIKMEEFEEVKDLQYDYFIKIIYFKDNSHFIVINSQNDYTTRFRYFNYINNNFISEIYTMIANGNHYIDVEKTQNDPGQNNNDIISLNSDRVIKVYTGEKNIIITIFQFYEHGTILFIKTYNMDNFYDSSFTHPRLAILKNTFLICLSAKALSQQTTGYFFINYPNSVDVSLTRKKYSIKINELISMENNLFLLKLKLKLTKIPKDFIFVNALDLKEVNETTELEFNDELKLQQYKIKDGPYTLKYQGIAVGDDSGYSSSVIYPTYKDKPEASNIYIEGREGTITITLAECLDGYYHLENDPDICTNVKPKGYYKDEEKNYLRICQSPCDDCDGPIINDTFMNCLSCKENFYITEDTKSCYDKEKENFYLDRYNILRRCHPRCAKCFLSSKNDTRMNCLKCIEDENNKYFYRDDTHNCILSSEFKKREFIVLTAVSNYSFIIFMIILFVSTIITLYVFSYSCRGIEQRIINEAKIEMKYLNYQYTKTKTLKEEKEEKEREKLEKMEEANIIN